MRYQFYRVIDDVVLRFREKRAIYCGLYISLLVGIVFGVVMAFISSVGSDILKGDDNIVYKFITSDVSIFSLLLDKYINIVIGCILLFCFCLNYYLLFLSLFFMFFQGFVFSASCVAIIKIAGVVGGLDVIFVLLPINLVMFILFGVFCEICWSRALSQKRYALSFVTSFRFEQNYWRNLLVSFFCMIAVVSALLVSLSLIFKSLVIIFY